MQNELKARAKKFRSNMTEAEKMLWQALRAKRFLGYKFRRQQIIGNYIVDFVSYSHKLIIELDGSQHFERQDYDEKRTVFLAKEGFRVIRFWNIEMYNQPLIVLDRIYDELMKGYVPSL